MLKMYKTGLWPSGSLRDWLSKGRVFESRPYQVRANFF